MTLRGKIGPCIIIAVIAAFGIIGEWHEIASRSPRHEPAAQGSAPSQAISRGGIQPSQIQADVTADSSEPKPATDFMPWLAGATALLAIAAFWQVAITRNAARRQLRAYVFITATTTVVANGKTRCEVVVKNSGQTPAYSVKAFVKAWIDIYPDPKSPPVLSFGDAEHPTCIGPTGEVVVWHDVAVSPTDLAEIRAERKAVWLIAEVTYADTFGAEWKTEVKDFMTGLRMDEEDRRMSIGNYRAS